mgnify:CR=1 FL=1
MKKSLFLTLLLTSSFATGEPTRLTCCLSADPLDNILQKIEETEEKLIKSEFNLDLHRKSKVQQKETTGTIDLAFYKANLKMLKKEKDNRDSLKKELEKYKYQVILFTDLIRKDEESVKQMESEPQDFSNVIYLKNERY